MLLVPLPQFVVVGHQVQHAVRRRAQEQLQTVPSVAAEHDQVDDDGRELALRVVDELFDEGGQAETARQIVVDTPSGPLSAHTRIQEGRVVSVAIDMVPSFVFDTAREIEVPGFGRIPVDLVCVGGFFAMVSASALGIELVPANRPKLIPLGMAVIEAANNAFRVYHPIRPEVNTVDVVEFYDEDPRTETARGAVVYGESHMDRSPCGTGTTAKMTLLHHRGKLNPGEIYKNAGPLGTVFEGQIVQTLPIGEFQGIVGQIRGTAQVTGYHQFVLDDLDPFPEGFLL